MGRRSLESGEAEAQIRRGREEAPGFLWERIRRRSCGRWMSCGGASPRGKQPRLSVRRLFGLDRSGPPPVQTQAGAPLRPWTIPNAIGFTRLALIPVFLVAALSSSDGVGALPATLFAVIGWGDYADGIAARVTRQYSRLGALMDPVTDRLLIVSGVVVTWRFDLLPRWALPFLPRASWPCSRSGATASRTASSSASTGPGASPWRP